MAYQSLGLNVAQADLWPAISRSNPTGGATARSFLLAADALDRGLAAVTVRLTADPWPTLTACHRAGVRAILNHRLAADSPRGHYSLLVAIDPHRATLHDPHFGPSRHLSREDLTALWEPCGREDEIVGRVLIAIAKADWRNRACDTCGHRTPEAITCHRCAARVLLTPNVVLGCLEPGCPGRRCQTIFCPRCDAGL